MFLLKNFFTEEAGQDMVEYALVVSLVVIVGVAAYGIFGNNLSSGVNNIASSVNSAL